MSPQPYYERDGITIYHGDCREILSDPFTASHCKVLITDPLYGIGHKASPDYGASWAGIMMRGDQDTRLRDEILKWWGDDPAAVFGVWRRPPPPNTRAILIWDKGPAFGMGDLSLPWKPSWEEIYILGTGWHGRRDEGILRGHICVSWESKGRTHPHEKPVTLFEHLISKAPPGDILDPFLGSGASLVAAKNLQRRAIGIEIEERYCEIAARRLDQGVLDFGAA